jgi:hypothetical protein
MGMGYGANFADVIDDKFVKETCPDELKELLAAIKAEDMDFEAFAQEAKYEDYSCSVVPEEAYNKLIAAFNDKTGLTVTLGFHDQDEEGDRYDQVNGAFWDVENAYQFTEAGKKYEKHINRKLYVSFG